jgi:hypothetical protein
MKLKNNLTREVIEESYRAQGYNNNQIEELMYSVKYGLHLENYVTINVSAEHMDILNRFLENDEDITQYFDNNGVLDVASLELDNDIYVRHLLGYY